MKSDKVIMGYSSVLKYIEDNSDKEYFDKVKRKSRNFLIKQRILSIIQPIILFIFFITIFLTQNEINVFISRTCAFIGLISFFLEAIMRVNEEGYYSDIISKLSSNKIKYKLLPQNIMLLVMPIIMMINFVIYLALPIMIKS